MPRVHYVKKARKDNPVCKAGESYYWWKFRYGGKHYSLTRPRQSQLTQSPYFGQLYSMMESVEDANPQSWDDFDALRDDIRSQLEDLQCETQDSLDNMPESLTYSPTGELLQERIDALDSAVSDIENIDEWDEDEPQPHDFMQPCDDCDGSGQLNEEDFDEDDRDSDRECLTCQGQGEIEDESEYESELADYEQRAEEHISNAISELTDAIEQAVV